jgi:hypothetical protein
LLDETLSSRIIWPVVITNVLNGQVTIMKGYCCSSNSYSIYTHVSACTYAHMQYLSYFKFNCLHLRNVYFVSTCHWWNALWNLHFLSDAIHPSVRLIVTKSCKSYSIVYAVGIIVCACFTRHISWNIGLSLLQIHYHTYKYWLLLWISLI